MAVHIHIPPAIFRGPEEIDSSAQQQHLAGQEQAQSADASVDGQGYSNPDQSGYMEDSEENSASGSGSEAASPDEIDVNYRQVDISVSFCTLPLSG